MNRARVGLTLAALVSSAAIYGCGDSILSGAGTIDWTRGTEHFAMTVTTPTPLQYDASCAETVQRIRAGELQAAGTFGEMQGFVRVSWQGCGSEPRFSFESTE